MFPNIPVCRGIARVAFVAAIVSGLACFAGCDVNENHTFSVSCVSHLEVYVVHVSSSELRKSFLLVNS